MRTAHLKAMAMHAREQIFVLDVDYEGIARMQVYAYQEMNLDDDEVVETGMVHAVSTDAATALIQELIAAGTLPIVLILN